MPISKLIPRGALVVLALLVFAAPAAAKTSEINVPGTLVIQNKSFPAPLQTNCAAVVFVQWANVPNTTSAAVTAQGSTGNVSTGFASGPAFNDVYTVGTAYTAPPGTHWVTVSQSTHNPASGPPAQPYDCSDLATFYRNGYTGATTVQLTVEIPQAVCDDANKKLSKQKKAVKKLNKKVKKAHGKKKKKLKKSLKKAKTKQKAAQLAVNNAC